MRVPEHRRSTIPERRLARFAIAAEQRFMRVIDPFGVRRESRRLLSPADVIASNVIFVRLAQERDDALSSLVPRAAGFVVPV